jgi:poly-gamma-glutamate capsule biosynthesis protein CapA/YwtB (metallophosphatase superfamily)
MWRWVAVFCWLSAALPAWAVDGTSRVSVVFVGDVMLDDGPGRVVRGGRDPFAHFAEVLQQADVRIANLECVVALGGVAVNDKPWTFRAHPRVLPLLKRHFDVVGLANNHSLDYGPDAFVEMLGRLDRVGLRYVGGGRDAAEAHAPLILERKGLRIALLAYNEFFPRSFQAEVNKPGVAWSEDEFVAHDIRRARSEHRADIVIPFMHWGHEYTTLANDRQRQLARWMIDAGADAVVGGHPHAIQDTETYRGKPIVYSLGNFVFDGFSEKVAQTGWLLHMELDAQGVQAWHNWTVSIDSEGVPHVRTQRPEQCWKQGDDTAVACP